MLETKNLKKVYKTKKGVSVNALNGVSIKFPEKGLVFLLGKSGSGKSTLLNLLGGLDKNDEGEIIMEAISVKNLSVAYENNTIIEDLSLSIPKGKISIIIGANGCGKSTFLKTLARINKPKAGEIFINKKDIKDNTIEYRLKLNDVPNSKYYFTTIKESSYYNDEKEFASDKSISVVKDSSLTIDNIKEYSLKENNFTYKLTPYYYKGTFYINVKVNIKSLEGIKNIKDKYLVPIKITIKFNSGDIVTTKPEGSYDTITYYRYIQKNRDVIWSEDNYVEGYTKTGNTKVQ